MKASYLIINADDLGYSPAVNQAVADLHAAGLVTSASLLVNQPFSEAGAEIARHLPRLSVGVHLNLSKGRPLLPATQIPTLVDKTGHFWTTAVFYSRIVLGQVNWDEVAAELNAQMEWAVQRSLRVDDLDTHGHFHLLPRTRRIVEDLARRYRVRAWRTPDVTATLLPSKVWNDLIASPPRPGELAAPHYLLSLHQWGQRLLQDRKIAAVLSQPGVVTELVVHPGYGDDPHLPLPDQLPPARRQAEVDLLTSPAFAEWLNRLGLRLISFADLGKT